MKELLHPWHALACIVVRLCRLEAPMQVFLCTQEVIAATAAAQPASPSAMETSQPAGLGLQTLQAPRDRRQYREHGRPPLRRASFSAPAEFSAMEEGDQTLELYNLGSTVTGLSASARGMTPGGGLRASSAAAFSEAAQPVFPRILNSFGPGSVP